MNSMRDRLAFFVVLLLGLAPAFAFAAQDTVPTPDPATAPVGILAEFPIRMLANPHAEVWFMRGQLQPSGRVALGVQTGQTVFYVETGTLGIEADGAVITADDGLVQATADESIKVEAGNSLMLPRDTEATAVNTSNQLTTFLMLQMYSAQDEGEGVGDMEEPIGLSFVGISVGAAEFIPAPGNVIIERVVVESGESMENVTLAPQGQSQGMDPGWMGMDLGTIETGSAEVQFEQSSFQNVVWPSMMSNNFPQPEPVQLTGTASLGQGDSYAAFSTMLTFTNTGDEPLTILRVIVSPRMGP